MLSLPSGEHCTVQDIDQPQPRFSLQIISTRTDSSAPNFPHVQKAEAPLSSHSFNNTTGFQQLTRLHPSPLMTVMWSPCSSAPSLPVTQLRSLFCLPRGQRQQPLTKLSLLTFFFSHDLSFTMSSSVTGPAVLVGHPPLLSVG